MENIPEKFLNEDKSLNSEALIKSYSELEKKMSSMISLPGEDADSMSIEKFNKAIGVPEDTSSYPINDLFDDEDIKNKFREIGLSIKQVESIYEIAEEFLSPVLSGVFQSHHESSSISDLRNFFGNEDKMHDALVEINSFGEKFLPKDAFESLSTSTEGIQSIYKMMQSMEPSIRTDKNASDAFSDTDLRRMMKDPKYWREQDPEYIRKIEQGFKKLYS